MNIQLTEFSINRIVTAVVEVYADQLTLGFTDIDGTNLVWPDSKAPERQDELWRSTCFELFLANNPEDSAYLEFNLSPSGDWNVYHFDDCRTGMRESGEAKLVSLEASPFEISAVFECRIEFMQKLIVGPTCILERHDGTFEYYAPQHAERPDFHIRRHHVTADLGDIVVA